MKLLNIAKLFKNRSHNLDARNWVQRLLLNKHLKKKSNILTLNAHGYTHTSTNT